MTDSRVVYEVHLLRGRAPGPVPHVFRTRQLAERYRERKRRPEDYEVVRVYEPVPETLATFTARLSP